MKHGRKAENANAAQAESEVGVEAVAEAGAGAGAAAVDAAAVVAEAEVLAPFAGVSKAEVSPEKRRRLQLLHLRQLQSCLWLTPWKLLPQQTERSKR